MRSTSEPPVRVWLEWLLGTPAPLICERFDISPHELGRILAGEVHTMRRMAATFPDPEAPARCRACGCATGTRYGRRNRDWTIWCALCACEAELAAGVGA
jgi:hypothetical protein